MNELAQKAKEAVAAYLVALRVAGFSRTYRRRVFRGLWSA